MQTRENAFICIQSNHRGDTMNKNFNSTNWREHLPVPVYGEHPEYNAFYYKAWELAHSHLKSIPGMPQDPYMDESLCDTQVWIWDSCFMALFCKFAGDVFPGVETLSNFYEVLYGERSLPKIVPSEKEPKWTRAVPGKESDIYIHIADNPPLFAWAEYENALYSGDKERIRDLLYNKRFLQKHYEWFDTSKGGERIRGVFLPTCLVAEDIGFRWEGGRSGMDNTPRGRKAPRDGTERPDAKDLLWVDALCQQALAARSLARLFRLVGDEENALLWDEKFDQKRDVVEKYYWDASDRFYYDIDVNSHDFCKVMTAGSFWALTSGVASSERAEQLAAHVRDERAFGGDVPLISLARSDGDYYSDGRYWRGGLWLPTAYAALKGLSEYGMHSLTHEAASKILAHMYATFCEWEPHTIWECYSPEYHRPALTPKGDKTSRPDFCGWSALGPISIYIEFVLGFCGADAFTKTLTWEMPENVRGEIGIKNFRFGDIITDVIAKNGVCTVKSNEPYTLVICGKEYVIPAGETEFKI